MNRFYCCLWAVCSLPVLFGCASDDAGKQQAQAPSQQPTLTASAPPVQPAGRKAYIDPQTGELSTPPEEETYYSQRSQTAEDTQQNVFDYVINEHGYGVLVPRNPQRHELKAYFDCNGNLHTTHDDHDTHQQENADCATDKQTGGEVQ